MVNPEVRLSRRNAFKLILLGLGAAAVGGSAGVVLFRRIEEPSSNPDPQKDNTPNGANSAINPGDGGNTLATPDTTNSGVRIIQTDAGVFGVYEGPCLPAAGQPSETGFLQDRAVWQIADNPNDSVGPLLSGTPLPVKVECVPNK